MKKEFTRGGYTVKVLYQGQDSDGSERDPMIHIYDQGTRYYPTLVIPNMLVAGHIRDSLSKILLQEKKASKKDKK